MPSNVRPLTTEELAEELRSFSNLPADLNDRSSVNFWTGCPRWQPRPDSYADRCGRYQTNSLSTLIHLYNEYRSGGYRRYDAYQLAKQHKLPPLKQPRPLRLYGTPFERKKALDFGRSLAMWIAQGQDDPDSFDYDEFVSFLQGLNRLSLAVSPAAWLDKMKRRHPYPFARLRICHECNYFVDRQGVDVRAVSVQNRFRHYCPSCAEDLPDCDWCNTRMPSELLLPAEGEQHVCQSCSHDLYQYSDGIFYNEPESDRNAITPDQGPSERETRMFKELVALEGERHAYKMPGNGVAPEGIDEILAYLKKELYKLPGANNAWSLHGAVNDLKDGLKDEQDSRHAGMVEWSTKAGTLPKRISKILHKKRSLKLSSPILTEIGNIARRHCPKHTDYLFDIVQEIDWERFDFGQRNGSCWWLCRRNAKAQMNTQHNFFALRFFDPANPDAMNKVQDDQGSYHDSFGEGRCWMLIQDGLLYLFNAYSKKATLQTMTRLIADKLGAVYRDCDVRNCEELSEGFWINHKPRPDLEEDADDSKDENCIGLGFVVGFTTVDQLPATHDFNLQGVPKYQN